MFLWNQLQIHVHLDDFLSSHHKKIFPLPLFISVDTKTGYGKRILLAFFFLLFSQNLCYDIEKDNWFFEPIVYKKKPDYNLKWLID